MNASNKNLRGEQAHHWRVLWNCGPDGLHSNRYYFHNRRWSIILVVDENRVAILTLKDNRATLVMAKANVILMVDFIQMRVLRFIKNISVEISKNNLRNY